MKKTKLIEYLFPSVIAWFTNRRIREKSKKRDWDDLSNYWKQRLTAKEVHCVENAADDLYHSEIQRKETIESKAASLFEAIGFAVSLVAIPILFMEERTALILLVLPMVNFILAGICSWHATKIGEFYLPTLQGIKENIESVKRKPESESKIHWTIEKLVSTEMNCPFILMKSNWLAAAHQHFLLGILSVITVFAIIILDTFLI